MVTQTTVFVFFLGHECVHCMNQLNTFAPMAGRLGTAGARIIAISADSPDGVAETFAGGESGASRERFPFLILADNEQKAFRSWGVHDRFLDAPIHGVVIVDRAGRLRWRHLGVEPFTHVGEVLTACEAINGG
jgi:peroxiredoxin